VRGPERLWVATENPSLVEDEPQGSLELRDGPCDFQPEDKAVVRETFATIV